MQLAAAPAVAPHTAATDLGFIEQTRIYGIAVNGNDSWFQVTASRSGRFTTEAFFAHAAGNIDLEIYDARQRLIGASRGSGNVERIDVEATANSQLFVRFRGSNRDVDLRLTNLVTIAGSQVTASGARARHHPLARRNAAAASGQRRELSARGQFASCHRQRGGNDSLVLAGLDVADTLSQRPGGAELIGPNYRVSAAGIEHVQVTGSGNNRASGIPSATIAATVRAPQSVRLVANEYVVSQFETRSQPRFSELEFALIGLEAETDLARARLRQQRQVEAALIDAMFCEIGRE
jgi:hypothetical protein